MVHFGGETFSELINTENDYILFVLPLTQKISYMIYVLNVNDQLDAYVSNLSTINSHKIIHVFNIIKNIQYRLYIHMNFCLY